MAATKLLSDNGVTSGITGYQLTGGNDGTLQLQTTTSGGTATTAMTIDTSQNVGIGTSSPTAVTGYKTLAINGSTGGLIYLMNNGSNAGYLYNDTTNVHLGSSGSTVLSFDTNNAERVRIDSSGNVGIGTSSPAYKLDVNCGSANTAVQLSGSSTNNTQATIVNSNSGSYVSISAMGATGFGVGGWPNSLVIEGVPSSTGNTVLGSYSNSIVFQTGARTERARIDSSGNLLVGTTSSDLSGKLTVKGANSTFTADGLSSSAQVNIKAHNGSGYDAKLYLECPGLAGGGMFMNRATAQIRVWSSGETSGVSLAANGTSWGSYSDERLKEIIEPIRGAAEKVATLRAVIGRYKSDADDKRRPFLIAQDVKAVLPEAVYQNSEEDDTLNLAYTDTIPLLVAAIQEQQAMIASQSELITTLTERITALENK